MFLRRERGSMAISGLHSKATPSRLKESSLERSLRRGRFFLQNFVAVEGSPKIRSRHSSRRLGTRESRQADSSSGGVCRLGFPNLFILFSLPLPLVQDSDLLEFQAQGMSTLPDISSSSNPVGSTSAPETNTMAANTPASNSQLPDSSGNNTPTSTPNEVDTSKLTSEVWNHFQKQRINGDWKAICNYCKKKYSGESKNGTSHLRDHLTRCNKRVIRDIRQTILKANQKKTDGKLKVTSLEFDATTARQELATMIIKHEYPLSMVDHVHFRVDRYLEEDVIPINSDFDILNWWKTTGPQFPILQAIVKDIYAIPVSSVASESTFSTGGRLISPHRSRLHPTTIEALTCSQNWLLATEESTLSDQSFCNEDAENETIGGQ